MTLSELIKELKKIEKQGGGNLLVVSSGDGEGNYFSELTNEFSYGNFNTQDNEVDHLDPIDPDVNSLILWPV